MDQQQSGLGPFVPTHISHKRVAAYPIARAEFHGNGSGDIVLADGRIVVVPCGFGARLTAPVVPGDVLVRYEPTETEPDGYLSLSPGAVFGRGYTVLSREPDATGAPAITRAEADSSLSAAPAPRVTIEAMKAKVASAEYFRSRTLTICILTLENGFTIVGKSACASPENYDQALGERYAYDDAFRQIWAFEGYLLRERLSAQAA